ncbi:hypothetical protein GJU40_15520 [Bacillus lacus]|uniref:VOC domain-containing protein n=2 Tax=Metabacillus lacus TaxID=1983721 RepID=A0A7X2M000_9BACI|nr:hypothetical protein [Metabacillus lacus]
MLHHIELYVSNLEESREFWSWLLDKLGYQLFQRWEKGFSWKLGDTYLVFVQTEDEYQEPRYHRRRTGLNHLAFFAESRDEVDYFTAELQKKGVSVLYQHAHPFAGGKDHYAVYFEDPDRMKVEIAAPE